MNLNVVYMKNSHDVNFEVIYAIVNINLIHWPSKGDPLALA